MIIWKWKIRTLNVRRFLLLIDFFFFNLNSSCRHWNSLERSLCTHGQMNCICEGFRWQWVFQYRDILELGYNWFIHFFICFYWKKCKALKSSEVFLPFLYWVMVHWRKCGKEGAATKLVPRTVNAITKGRDSSVEMSMSSFKTPLRFLGNICIGHVYNQLLKLFCYKSGHIFLLLTDTVEETLHEYKQEQVFSLLCFRTQLLFQLCFFHKCIGCIVMKEHALSSKISTFF